MVKRLFLILLLLGFAVPPLLACTGDMQAMAHEPVEMANCHESAERSPPANGQTPHPPRHQDCIGCIAPLAIAMFRPVSEPHFYEAYLAPMRAGAERAARPKAPEPPPPKDFV